jgi:hypothetical protein
MGQLPIAVVDGHVRLPGPPLTAAGGDAVQLGTAQQRSCVVQVLLADGAGIAAVEVAVYSSGSVGGDHSPSSPATHTSSTSRSNVVAAIPNQLTAESASRMLQGCAICTGCVVGATGAAPNSVAGGTNGNSGVFTVAVTAPPSTPTAPVIVNADTSVVVLEGPPPTLVAQRSPTDGLHCAPPAISVRIPSEGDGDDRKSDSTATVTSTTVPIPEPSIGTGTGTTSPTPAATPAAMAPQRILLTRSASPPLAPPSALTADEASAPPSTLTMDEASVTGRPLRRLLPGVGRVHQELREVVEMALTQRHLFDSLGLPCPAGVLLCGP